MALFLSAVITIACVAYVNRVRKTVRFTWLGALVTHLLVIATMITSSRRYRNAHT